jgi:UDP-N-acetylglucosamine 4-epimerase
MAWAALRAALPSSPRRWLVTGAAGFIGSNLVEALLALGQEVVGLDDLSTGHRANLDDVAARVGPAAAARLRFLEGDVADPAACAAACAGVEFVLHQAALGSVPRSLAAPLASHRANVDGFLALALAARDAGVRRFVYASSSSVYGDHPALPKREDAIGRPLSPYAATKRIDELYAGVVERCYGLPTIGLRYFNVYGRRQDPAGAYAAVIPRWIARLARGEACEIFGDGSQSRDFTYVDDAIQANLLAATAPGDGVTDAVYNVGAGARTTLRELHDRLRGEVARHRPAAAALAPVHLAARPGDVPHSLADVGKIASALGYAPTHAVADGLPATVDWFLARA